MINLYVTIISIFIPFYLIQCLRHHSFSLIEFIGCIEGFSKSGYFIQNYLLLMFFSPVLNSFVAQKGRNILWWVVAFCGIEFWFECIKHVEQMGFSQGYSFIHFVLMYMIGRCLYLYQPELQRINKYIWLLAYFVGVLVLCGMYLLNIGHSWEYCNPFVILTAVCLFMPFTYCQFHNKYINSIAKSTLAVYIMQVFDPGKAFLIFIDNQILLSLPYYQYLLLSIIVLIAFFCLCICYDKIRLLITTPILSIIYAYFSYNLKDKI